MEIKCICMEQSGYQNWQTVKLAEKSVAVGGP